MRLRFSYEGRRSVPKQPRHTSKQEVQDLVHVQVFVWYNMLASPMPAFGLALRIVQLTPIDPGPQSWQPS